jgi:hypothetical protein
MAGTYGEKIWWLRWKAFNKVLHKYNVTILGRIVMITIGYLQEMVLSLTVFCQMKHFTGT